MILLTVLIWLIFTLLGVHINLFVVFAIILLYNLLKDN